MARGTKTIYLALEVREDYQMWLQSGHLLSGIKRSSTVILSVMEIKDPAPALAAMTEERDLSVQKNLKLRAQIARLKDPTRSAYASDFCSECGGDLRLMGGYRKSDGRGGMVHSRQKDCGQEETDS